MSESTDYSSPVCDPFDVRLAYREIGGAIGNLEICTNNTWQAVCDTALFPNTVLVACQALGFTDFMESPLRHITVPPVVMGAGPIFEDELFCTGNEESLGDCERLLVQNDGACTHFDDVRVKCLGESCRMLNSAMLCLLIL